MRETPDSRSLSGDTITAYRLTVETQCWHKGESFFMCTRCLEGMVEFASLLILLCKPCSMLLLSTLPTALVHIKDSLQKSEAWDEQLLWSTASSFDKSISRNDCSSAQHAREMMSNDCMSTFRHIRIMIWQCADRFGATRQAEVAVKCKLIIYEPKIWLR